MFRLALSGFVASRVGRSPVRVRVFVCTSWPLRSPQRFPDVEFAAPLVSPLLPVSQRHPPTAVCNQSRVPPNGRVQFQQHVQPGYGLLALLYKLPLPDVSIQYSAVRFAAGH